MTNKLINGAGNKIATLFLSVSLLMTVSACTKKASSADDAAKFVGLWKGVSTCGTDSTQLAFGAGTYGTTLFLTEILGEGTCAKIAFVNVSASGNNLTIPSQTYVDACGAVYTISGTGTLNGNILRVSLASSTAGLCIYTLTK